MVGEKMTNVLITQLQKQEPEVNPLLHIAHQIFIVKFCVSKISYPGDFAIGEFWLRYIEKFLRPVSIVLIQKPSLA